MLPFIVSVLLLQCHRIFAYVSIVGRSHLTTSMSSVSTWNVPAISWNSSNVIDNIIYGDPNVCKCCASTSGNEHPWLQIDLGRYYRISLITIYGRTDGSSEAQYKNLNIFVSNTSMETVNGSLVFSGNPNNGIFTYTLPLKPPMSFRYLMIRRFTASVMTICEVEYIEAISDLNLCDRLRTTVVTSQSSILLDNNDYQPSNSIDGKYNYDIDTCRCCSVTKETPLPSWWQIDLRNKYTVDKVEIFGRQSDAHQQLVHAELYAGNTSMATDSNSGQWLYTVPNITNSSHFIKYVQPAITAQFFIIRLQSNILTLCEFKVYEKEEACDVGCFGAACSLKCHCADGKICNSLTGVCQTPGCLPGWTGQACDRECPYRQFGRKCATQCHCFNDTQCNKVNGVCAIGYCDSGWQGSSCSQECSLGTFGQNCTSRCHCFQNTSCNSDYGICNIGYCDPGWQGRSCNEECPFRRFGQSCTTECRCLNNTSCNKINGICTIGYCDPGYHGQTCSQVCPFRRYGQNCTAECHCFNNTSCNNTDGICNVGYCEAGWRGPTCNQECSSGTFGQNCTSRCHCFQNTPCNSDHGTCDIGYCDPGWQGRSCSIECPFRRFGQNCTTECRCLSNTSCNKIDGTCTIGYCDPGYHGQTCSQVCPFRRYGQNCTAECHCFNKTACNNTDGICNVGYCEAGWKVPTCNQACPARRFGMNCSSECHCFNNTGCHFATGVCDIGHCNPGWQGVTCSEAGNILLRLKGQINTEMSSVAHNWTSERAIDGLVGPDPNKCNCCSGTKNSKLSWWRLDLGKQVSIKLVSIYSRDKESNYQDLNGFQLYLTNKTDQDSSAMNTNTNTYTSGNSFEVTIPNTLARYVTIKRPGVLTICEVMIFEGECRLGTYGEECLDECHCADNKPCNKESGRCQTLICKTGWKGGACNQGCPQDSFGDDCKERCFCAEGTCTTSYGICPGDCRQGYHGPHCNIEGSGEENEKRSSNITTVGGSVGGSVACLIIIFAVVYLFIRYRRTKRYQDEHKNVYTNPSPYIQQSENSEYDTLDTLQDTPRTADDGDQYLNEQITGV